MKINNLSVDNLFPLILLLFCTFIIRLLPIFFPNFTSEEARIGYRGYTLATSGKDELGRSFPLLFNSIEDYQLPAVSYITATGVLFFGKSDFGVRIPFVLIGTAIILFTYLIAKSFSEKPFFWLSSGMVAALSPPLIFLSKTPNEIIVLTFIFTLLFYLLINNKNLFLTIIIMIAAVLVSKLAWFILLPFTIFTIYRFNKRGDRKSRILVGASVVIVTIIVSLFLTVPQSQRSLLENNFSLFNDITIKNGIDKLRGQGAQSGWPGVIDRILFNKTHFLLTGFLHWSSNLSPAVYFGRFDQSGIQSFAFIGVFLKILLIPAIFGIFFILRREWRYKSLLFYLLILTLPSLLIYPNLNLEVNILTIPFFAVVIGFGFMQLNKKITALIFVVMFLEFIITVSNLPQEYKNSEIARPTWIRAVSLEAFENSKKYQTAISDDIVSDVVPLIEWYAPAKLRSEPADVRWPYKFRQYSLENIKIIASGDNFRSCGKDEKEIIFVSIRDLKKIKHEIEVNVAKAYQDSTGEDKVYLLSNNLCIN